MLPEVREILASLRVVTNAASRRPTDPLTIDVIPTPPIGLSTTVTRLYPIRVKAWFSKPAGPDGKRVPDDRIAPKEIPERGKVADDSAAENLLSLAYTFAPILSGQGGALATEASELVLRIMVQNPDYSPPQNSSGKAAKTLAEVLDDVTPFKEPDDEDKKVLDAGLQGYRDITIPFALPVLGIPTFAIIGSGTGLEPFVADGEHRGEPNATVLFTPLGSGITALEEGIRQVSGILDTLNSLAAFVGFLGFVMAPLRILSKVLPAPEYDFRVGDQPDLDEIGANASWVSGGANFGENNRSIFAIGPKHLKMKLWLTDDYEKGVNQDSRVLVGASLIDVLNPQPGQNKAVFMRRQLDKMLARLGISGLPPLEMKAKAKPLQGLPKNIDLSIICIYDWDDSNIEFDPVLLTWIPKAADRKIVRLEHFFFLKTKKPMARDVEGLQWLKA